MKRDYRSIPFKKMITLGESHTSGISATRREWGWAPLLKDLIDQFQKEPVALKNHGIGGDILSKDCPVYKDSYQGKRPIAIERYQKHVIEETSGSGRGQLRLQRHAGRDSSGVLRTGSPHHAFGHKREHRVA